MGNNSESFFVKYESFESRIEAAIKSNDVPLVQILLGPKYCQLWQLWLIHGIISSKALNVEKIVNNKLMVNIACKQMEIIEDHKRKLETRKKQLERGDNNNLEQINSGLLFKNLAEVVKNSAEECKTVLTEELNKLPDYRSYYIPVNAAEVNDAEELNLLMQQISTVSSAEKLYLNKEFDYVINELSNKIEGELWDAFYINTKLSLLLDPFKRCSNNNATHNVVRMFLGGANTGILCFLNLLPSLSNLLDGTNSIPSIESRLNEIDGFFQNIEAKLTESYTSQARLNETCTKIQKQIFEKLNDGKFIDKQLVKDMYTSLLYNYLTKAKMNRSNLLFNDIAMENGCIEKVADKILKEVGFVDNYDKFGDILAKELGKENPNYNIVQLFIVNSTPILSYRCVDQNTNVNLDKIMKKSFHTIMIDINDLLFNFESKSNVDVDVMLVSHLPNKDGTYTRSCKNNIVVCGNNKQHDLVTRVRKFSKEVECLIEKGGLNRVRGYAGIPAVYYFFKDFFVSIFSQHTPNTEIEQNLLHDKIKEFYIKMSHSVAVDNEGMIKEYIEDIKERMKYEEHNDIRELYSIILGSRWRDMFRKTLTWEDTPNEQSLEYFTKITNKRVNAFKILEMQRKANMELRKAQDDLKGFQDSNERSNFFKELYSMFGRKIYFSDIDSDVKTFLFEEQDNLINDIVNHCMSHGQNRSLDELLEEFLERCKEKFDKKK